MHRNSWANARMRIGEASGFRLQISGFRDGLILFASCVLRSHSFASCDVVLYMNSIYAYLCIVSARAWARLRNSRLWCADNTSFVGVCDPNKRILLVNVKHCELDGRPQYSSLCALVCSHCHSD
jgi:hypothetical protein